MIPDPRSGRWLRAFALLAFIATVILACADKRAGAPKGTRRIVTIGGPITETVYALGGGADVVATDTSSIYPAATATLPKVGYQRLLSAEGVLSQRPDLVIASDDAGPPAVLQQIRTAGIAVEIMPPARTIDEAAARVLAVGKAIDRPAQQLADHVQTSAKAAKPSTKGTRFMLVYARGGGTMMVAGADTPAAAMVELAGGVNAFTAFPGFKTLSPEAMIAAAPEVIVIPTRGLESMGGAAGLLASPGVAETPAGKARRIIAIDDLLLLGFGPRLALGIEELAAQL